MCEMSMSMEPLPKQNTPTNIISSHQCHHKYEFGSNKRCSRSLFGVNPLTITVQRSSSSPLSPSSSSSSIKNHSVKKACNKFFLNLCRTTSRYSGELKNAVVSVNEYSTKKALNVQKHVDFYQNIGLSELFMSHDPIWSTLATIGVVTHYH